MAMILMDFGGETILNTMFGNDTKATEFWLGLLVADPTYDTTGDNWVFHALGNDMNAEPTNTTTHGGTDVAPLVMELVDAYVTTKTSVPKTPYVEWREGGVSSNPYIDFSWTFENTGSGGSLVSGRLRGTSLDTVGTDAYGAYGGIWGYVIQQSGGTADGEIICAERFTTVFVPEPGATLKITPKIYLGNVGDF